MATLPVKLIWNYSDANNYTYLTWDVGQQYYGTPMVSVWRVSGGVATQQTCYCGSGSYQSVGLYQWMNPPKSLNLIMRVPRAANYIKLCYQVGTASIYQLYPTSGQTCYGANDWALSVSANKKCGIGTGTLSGQVQFSGFQVVAPSVLGQTGCGACDCDIVGGGVPTGFSVTMAGASGTYAGLNGTFPLTYQQNLRCEAACVWTYNNLLCYYSGGNFIFYVSRGCSGMECFSCAPPAVFRAQITGVTSYSFSNTPMTITSGPVGAPTSVNITTNW
jgi:hypothetical protein